MWLGLLTLSPTGTARYQTKEDIALNNTNIPIILDIEASGFGPESYPIEIGIAFMNEETRCFLIKPERHWTHWDEQAQSVHHIDPQVLRDKGSAAKEVAEQINTLLYGKTVYTDAWCFDYSWLNLLFHTMELPMRFRLESVLTLLPEEALTTWNATKTNVINRLGRQRHRASVDARVIQLTYLSLAERFASDYSMM